MFLLLFQNKCTPLHLAARNGDDEIVQVLFEHKPPLLELNQVSRISFLVYVSFCGQWRSQPDIWSCKCKFFCVYRPYKESISEEMNNDNDLNFHSMTKLSG